MSENPTNAPILIAAPTRCGTTMLAWLLHLHGVWIGEAGVTKAPETNPQVGTENLALKRCLRGVRGVPGDFREQILSRVDTDGPWLCKTAGNLTARDAWAHHFPDAKWLLPRRPVDDIVRSKMRHPGMAKRGQSVNRQRTVQHIKLQDEVSRNPAMASLDVDADTLCRGGEDGEAEARRVFEFCGLTLDVETYRKWVQPERWHGA